MGEIEEVVGEIERLCYELIPRSFEVLSVRLAPTEDTPFAIVVRVVRCNEEPEPLGWLYDLRQRIRERWGSGDFQLSVLEEIVEE